MGRLGKGISLLAIPLSVLLIVGAACGDDAAVPTPLPTATPIDTAGIVQQAVTQALSQVPAGATAAEIAAIVQREVAAGAQPAGVTAKEVEDLVAMALGKVDTASLLEQAVSQALAGVPAGATTSEVQGLVEKAISDALAQVPPGVTTAEIEDIVQREVTAAAGDSLSASEIRSLVSSAVQTSVESAVGDAVESAVGDAVAALAPTPTPVAMMPSPKMVAGAIQGDTLSVWDGWAAEPSHYDVHQSQSASALWAAGPLSDTILRRDPVDGNRTLIPDLAERWQHSDDLLTWIFHFRSGVKFHDGSDFTAADAVATLEKIVAPGEGIVSPKAPFFEPSVDSIVATDTLTMEVRLKQPFTLLLEMLANPFLAVVSKAQLDALDGSLRETYPFVATGPFILTDHRFGEVSGFERFPDYWNAPRPYLDRLDMVWAAKPASLAAFEAGQADWFHSPATADIDRLLEDPTAKYMDGPAYVLDTVFWNTQRAPFDSPLVRQAADMVIDRTQIVQAINPILLGAPGSYLAPGTAYADSESRLATRPGYGGVSQADIDRAAEMVRTAGHEGATADLLIRGPLWDATVVAPFLVDALGQIGITLNTRVTDFGVYYDEVLNRDYGATVATLGLQTADPYENLASYYLEVGAPVNLANYDNPQARQLINEIGATPDGPARAVLVERMLDLLNDDTPASFLSWLNFPVVMRTYVKGVPESDLGLYGRYRFDHVFIDGR